MGEIRWKLKVMFLNNDTLNTIEAQYGSKTEDIIHQFELFLYQLNCLQSLVRETLLVTLSTVHHHRTLTLGIRKRIIVFIKSPSNFSQTYCVIFFTKPTPLFFPLWKFHSWVFVFRTHTIVSKNVFFNSNHLLLLPSLSHPSAIHPSSKRKKNIPNIDFLLVGWLVLLFGSFVWIFYILYLSKCFCINVKWNLFFFRA